MLYGAWTMRGAEWPLCPLESLSDTLPRLPLGDDAVTVAGRLRTDGRHDDGDRHRHQGRSVGAQDPARDLRVHDVPRRRVGSADDRLPGRRDEAPLRRPGDRRAPRDAQGARRLDAARRRGRAEAGARGHGRGVGPVRVEPARRLVRPEEGPARPVRRVHAAAPRGARPGRGHPRRQEQPDAGHADDGRCPRRRPAIRSTPWATRTAGPSSSSSAPGERSVQRDRGRAPDQPARRLPPPAAPEAGGARRREAPGDAADLPAPRPGRRGRPGLRRARLGRGRVARFRLVASQHRGRASPRGDRADPPGVRGGLPGRPRVRRLDGAHRPVVAAGPHRVRRGRADRRPGGPARRPDLRAPAGRAWSTTGARSRSGSRRPGSATRGTSIATERRHGRRDPVRARGDGGHPGRDRAPRLGTARAPRARAGATGTTAAGRRSCRITSGQPGRPRSPRSRWAWLSGGARRRPAGGDDRAGRGRPRSPSCSRGPRCRHPTAGC